MGVCDDLISRQAAIEAIGEKPFVQIESQEDIDYEQGLQNQWQRDTDRIKLLQPAQRWIPVSERLPEKNSDPEKYLDRWLCCTSNGDIMILFYGTPGDGTKECAFYKWGDDGYFYQTFDVIAWMPIPKQYRKGEEK